MLKDKSSGKDSRETTRKHKNRKPTRASYSLQNVTQNRSEILMLNHKVSKKTQYKESLQSAKKIGQRILNMIQKACPIKTI